MTIASSATPLSQPIDPRDVDYFGLKITQVGDELPSGREPILEADEVVTSYTLTMGIEAIAAGLKILDGDKAPFLSDRLLVFWLEIEDGMEADPVFYVGLTLPIELTVVTSKGRTKQRTATVRVINL